MTTPLQSQYQSSGTQVPLAQQIGTRDGTLAKDAKLVNLLTEQVAEGPAVVKRPGTVSVLPLSGTPQGQFLCSGLPYAIVGDVIYSISTGAIFAIPTVTTMNQQYSTLSDVPFGSSLLKSPSGLWVFNGTVVTKVTDANYPALTVPGICELDGTYYVMDSLGEVFGSSLQDPTTWPALQFIQADTSLGQGSGIIRHLNYIVAFYTHGVQFYYDAGNSPGIPLGVVSNASWTTGTASGASLVELADTTYFIGSNVQYGRSICMFQGLQLTIISNPFIEKILNLSNLSAVYSFGIKTAGHSLYVLTLVDTGVTLVYDTIFGVWSGFSSVVSGVEQHFVGVNYVNSGSQDLLQDLSTGSTIAMSTASFVDTTGPINCLVRTPNLEWGTLYRKRFAAVYLLADTVSSTISVRYSDDDYQSYSAYRAIDLTSVRKMLQRCGSSRRRSWDFLHTAATPFKAYTMLLDMSIGTS